MSFDVVVTKPPDSPVVVTERSGAPVQVSVPAQPSAVEVRVPGPAGPAGAKGDRGPAGLPGGGDAHYVHPQNVPAAVWTVPHGLGKRPAVTVVDSAGTQVEGDVTHVGTASLTIEFAFPFSGTALLN